VVLITGAAQGQGAAEARAAAARGATVVLTDVSDADGETVAAEVGGTYVHLDVSNAAEWEATIAAVLAQHGRLDGLVNNAGIFLGKGMLDTTEDEFRRMFEINQLGVHLGMAAVAPGMIERGSGSIVNISSVAGLRGFPAYAYTGTKHAITGLTKTAARELAPHGVRVNSVHPGIVDTPMLPADRMDALSVAAPMGRVADADEVAELVMFLLSDASSYITGSAHTIDGGLIA